MIMIDHILTIRHTFDRTAQNTAIADSSRLIHDFFLIGFIFAFEIEIDQFIKDIAGCLIIDFQEIGNME